MLRLAIFDMDGVLIDSEPFWRASHIEVVASLGNTISESDVRVMAGRRTDEVVREWHRRFKWQSVSPEEIEQLVVSKLIATIQERGRALLGVDKIIAELASHNIPMVIASSSSIPVIEAVIDKLELKQHIKLFHSAKNEKYGKPHPAVFLSAAEQMGIDRQDCLVFEDSVNGVIAAKAAGMKCIAIPEAANFDKPGFAIADQKVSSLNVLDYATLTQLWTT